jgi:(E)-4-hydroxy-3-methylbut-2-enyl-diphosphate synthase
MVGKVQVGGDAPISIQSMTNTLTYEVDETLDQIKRLEDAGCEIIRVTVEKPAIPQGLSKIKAKMRVPLVADIHFAYQIALVRHRRGCGQDPHQPGNIGGMDRLAQVVEKCKKYNVAMRVGVNSGSLEKDLLEKYGHPTPEAIVESAMRHIASSSPSATTT